MNVRPLLLLAAVLLLFTLALYPGPSLAQELPATPTRTPKACHICDEEEAALTTRLAVAPTTPAAAPPAQLGAPVVRAVLFWMDTCPHCHEVIENVLPPLQAQYGLQLQVVLVQVKTTEQFQQLYPVADCYGFPRDYFGVPFLVIGTHGLLGPDQIAAELPGLIDGYLAAGGVGLPDSACLRAALSAANIDICLPEEEDCGEAAPGAVTRPSGFFLAIAVLVGMVGSLIIGSVLAAWEWRAVPARKPARARRAVRRPAWQEWAVPVLAVVGLAVAGYLAYVELRAVPAVCGPVGDCNAVQNSDYALLLGFLPVGLLGVLGYVAILIAWAWGRFRADRLARWAPVALLGGTLFGTLFSIYLTYLEPFVIRAVCAWCLTSAVIMAALLLLSVRPAVRALRGEKRR